MAEGAATFAAEKATFEAKREEWVRDGFARKWMAVWGDKFLGPFDRFGWAWDAAVEAFHTTQVLVQRVTRDDRPLIASAVQQRPTER